MFLATLAVITCASWTPSPVVAPHNTPTTQRRRCCSVVNSIRLDDLAAAGRSMTTDVGMLTSDLGRRTPFCRALSSLVDVLAIRVSPLASGRLARAARKHGLQQPRRRRAHPPQAREVGVARRQEDQDGIEEAFQELVVLLDGQVTTALPSDAPPPRRTADLPTSTCAVADFSDDGFVDAYADLLAIEPDL